MKENIIENEAVAAEEEMTAKKTEESLQFVTFEMEGEEFAVDVLKVQEIIRPVEVTDIPHCLDFLDGLINLRGKIFPVINLRKRFNYPQVEAKSENRVIVVDIDGEVIGLYVDQVSEILRISPDVVEPAPVVENKAEKEYLSGMAQINDRIVIILDIDKILNTNMKQALGSLETADKVMGNAEAI